MNNDCVRDSGKFQGRETVGYAPCWESVTRRSIFAAAAEPANLRALAARNEESRMMAGQQIKEMVKNQRATHGCAPSIIGGGEIINSPVSEYWFQFSRKYDEIHLAGRRQLSQQTW